MDFKQVSRCNSSLDLGRIWLDHSEYAITRSPITAPGVVMSRSKVHWLITLCMVSSGCNSHPLGSVLGWKSSHARALCWKLKFPEIDSECRRDVGRARTQSRWRVAHALRRLWTTTPKAALASVVGPFQAVGMARASCIVHLTALHGTRARRKQMTLRNRATSMT